LSTHRSKHISDRRKQSLYFPADMLADLDAQARRLDRSLSWIVQRCCKVALPNIKDMPDVEGVEAAE
jgi:uncharacterized small protein (TIGR04563 family)